MKSWTKENLTAHRMQRGWEDLSDYQIDQVLAILNAADETLTSLDDVSWTEPVVQFSVKNCCDNGSK